MLSSATDRRALRKVNLLLWEREAGVASRIAMALLGACVTGLCAQFRVQTPISPVPFTGQVFAVLLCAVLLGGRYGALSQALYAGLGALGVPWFAGGAAGLVVLRGLSAGYIAGFIVAAGLVGWLTRRSAWARTFDGLVCVMLLGMAVIYLCGAGVLMSLTGGAPAYALAVGVLPFIAFDLLKVLGAAAVARGLLRP